MGIQREAKQAHNSRCNPARVAVITGASSGIGHATALEFARNGWALVLAARDQATLDPVAIACGCAGAHSAIGVPTDVTDAAQVERLAEAAFSKHGHIDVWVNGVGVGAVGQFEETPLDAHRRVIETNLIGHINGAYAALRHFRKQGRGTLINMISIGGWIAAPYAAAYSASKFGLRGLSESLRAEVSDLRDVHVCDVAPTFVNSPGLSHAANYTGHNIQARIPLVDPQRVARAIAALTRHPRDVTWVGSAAAPGRLVHALAPRALGAAMQRLIGWALGNADPAEPTDGNLYLPSKGTGVYGSGLSGHAASLPAFSAGAARQMAVFAAAGILIGLALSQWSSGRR